MKISDKGIEVIKGNKRLRNRLALEMDKSQETVERWYRMNPDNGDLTTAKALQIIREETGLTDDQILDESEEHIRVAS